MTENHFNHIGELLQNAREDRGLSIMQAASALHIRKRYLIALEDGALEALPGLPYVRGYLTRYASFLGLDTRELMRRFDQMADQQKKATFFLPHTFSQEKQVPPIALYIGMAALFLGIFVWVVWGRFTHQDQFFIDEVPQKIEAMASLPTKIPCTQYDQKLYPPCYWPKTAPQKSIMYLVK